MTRLTQEIAADVMHSEFIFEMDDDELRDEIHLHAFAEALALPILDEAEAPEISDEVHANITDILIDRRD